MDAFKQICPYLQVVCVAQECIQGTINMTSCLAINQKLRYIRIRSLWCYCDRKLSQTGHLAKNKNHRGSEDHAKSFVWKRPQSSQNGKNVFDTCSIGCPFDKEANKLCTLVAKSNGHHVVYTYALSTGIGFRLWRSLLEKLGYLRKWLEFGFKTSAQGRRGSMGDQMSAYERQ